MVKDSRSSSHAPADATSPEVAERFGNAVLGLLFYIIVAAVVVASLITTPGPWLRWPVGGLILSGLVYAAFPAFLGHCGAWRNADGLAGEGDSTRATTRGRLIFLFAFIPVGVVFSYFSMTVGQASFFPILPLFMLAGFSSTLFSYLGSIVCSLTLIGAQQAMLALTSGFWFRFADLFGITVGLIVFNMIFLMANSAVRAHRKAEKLARDLEASNTKLRDYAMRVEDLAIAEERNRLAREIHDSLGHALTVINVQIEAARTVLEADRGKASAALEAAQAYTRQGLKEVREAVSSLRASPLAKKTLVELIEGMAGQAATTGVEVDFQVEGEPRRLPPSVELTLHRAAQEAVTNTLRHAQARHLWLRLDFRGEQSVRLTVEDDGVGADATELSGYGLLGLRERVGHHGGESSLRTAPGEGFRLEVQLPLT